MPSKRNPKKKRKNSKKGSKPSVQATKPAPEPVAQPAQPVVHDKAPAQADAIDATKPAPEPVTQPAQPVADVTAPAQADPIDLASVRAKRLSLKEQGNKAFGAKDWAAARTFYSKAIDALALTTPGVEQADTTLQAVLWSNRAMCCIKASPPLFKLAIADCDMALAADGGYIKAMFRKAQAHEGLAAQLGSAGGCMEQLRKAMTQLSILVKQDPKNAPAVLAARRVRQALDKENSAMRSPLVYIDQIKAGTNLSSVPQNIQLTMHLYVAERFNQLKVLEARFPSVLLDFALLGAIAAPPKDLPKDTPATATRALNTLLLKTGSELKEYQRLLGKMKEAGVPTAGQELPPVLHPKDIEAFHAAAPKIYGRVGEFIKLNQTSIKETKGMHEASHRQFLNFIIFISRFASHPSFEVHRERVLAQLLACIHLIEQAPSLRADPLGLAVISAALKAIAGVAAADAAGLELTRSLVLSVLLFSSISSNNKVRKALIACLSVVAGNDVRRKESEVDKYDKMNKKKDGELTPDEEKTLSSEKKFRQTLTHFVVSPLLSQAEDTITKALIALSLLLQAHPSFGIEVVKARWKLQTEGGAPVQVPNTPADAGGGGAEGDPKEKKEEGTSALELLLFLATDMPEDIQKLAAEVLALSSSDKLIRETIVAAENQDIFLMLLEGEDHLVRAYAGVALAKIAVVGVDTASDQEHERILGPVVEVLKQFVDYEHEQQQKAKAGDEERDEYDRFGLESDDTQRRQDCVRTIIETLAYLSLNVITKKILASKENGQWLKHVLTFASSKDKSVRFGVVSIIHNMTVSADDINRAVDKEVEALRKVAAKGLPGAEQREEMTKKSGDAKTIKVVRQLLTKAGGTAALNAAFNSYQAQHKEEEDKKQAQPSDTDVKADEAMPDFVVKCFTSTLLYMASEQENRGLMVQQGALRLLLNVYGLGDDKAKEQVAVAIARIAITTNPHLYPQQGLIFSLVAPLLKLVVDSTNELHQFEALMALTNLVSVGEDVQEKFMNCEGWVALMGALSSDNHRIQCATVECMTNLITCKPVVERLRSAAGDQDLQILLMFCGTDDVQTQMAATGAIAMVSADHEVAVKIARSTLTSYIQGGDEGDEGDGAEEGQEYTRNGCEALRDLVINPELHPDVRLRVDAAIENVGAALKDEAERQKGQKSLK